jgi:8-oxo-dGTP diphosphatase
MEHGTRITQYVKGATMSNRPRIGVGVLVIKGDRLLLIKRQGVHGQGTWSTPGGHLEYGESPEACAARETMEETGVEIANVRALGFTNDLFKESGLHYITLWMRGEHASGEAVVAAPYEASEVAWFAGDALPEPLFLPLRNLVTGKSYPSGIEIYK